MREIVLDTETTGLDPAKGDRVVEIACVELFNQLPTGEIFHCYINPERAMPEEATKIHGLTDDFLAPQPKFVEVVDGFLGFLRESQLVIHNAEFDLRFLNAELRRLSRSTLALPVVDTLLLARRKFPGAQASLDALCRRFGIDLSGREKHNARLDCELLAAVYLELIGGRQPGLDLLAGKRAGGPGALKDRPFRAPRPHAASDAEIAAHRTLLNDLKQPLWLADETGSD